MKPSVTFSVMRQPLLVMSDELLASVRRVVGRSQLEAQWFHTVERIEDKNRIFFVLSNLLIPKQYVSGAFVETTPEFQVDYWNYLVEKFGSNEAASDAVRTSGAWCHSHVNMVARPSGTDDTTFQEHCTEAQNTGNTTPQLMLIFNKKDEFYSRVWDPVTGCTYEGLELVTTESKDWSNLDAEMDSKFLKRPTVVVESAGSSRPTLGSQATTPVKKAKSAPVDLSKTDYRIFHDALEAYQKDGLAQDMMILREIADKYLSNHYYYPLFQLGFAKNAEIKRLATKFFLSKEFYQTTGDSAKTMLFAKLATRDFDATRIATALDYTIDLAASERYGDAIEIITGFLQDMELVEPKSPHTHVTVNAWGNA